MLSRHDPFDHSRISLATASARIIALSLALSLMLAGCGPAQATPVAMATVTPLAESTPTVAPPTSTPAPTVVVIDALQDVITGKKYLAEGNYDLAMRFFTPVYALNPDNPEAQRLLADAYLQWADATLKEAGENEALLPLALDRYTSGQAVAPSDGPLVARLNEGKDFVLGFREARSVLETLAADPAPTDVEGARVRAAALVGDVERLLEQHDLPIVRGLLAESLLAAAALQELQVGSIAEQEASLEQARSLCDRATGIAADSSAATACVARVDAALSKLRTPTATPAPPTRVPTPRPPPTPVVQRLYMRKINSNDSPTCISIRITGINPQSWILRADGYNIPAARFGGQDARLCGLPAGAEFTFSLYEGNNAVRGGSGIPARGGDIFVGEWR